MNWELCEGFWDMFFPFLSKICILVYLKNMKAQNWKFFLKKLLKFALSRKEANVKTWSEVQQTPQWGFGEVNRP